MKKLIYVFVLLLSIVYSTTIYSQCVKGDCNNGVGTLKYTNATYIGEFKNGKRNGFGELTFINGIVSKGTFYNDNCCFGFNEYQQSPTSDGFVNYSMRYNMDSSENHFQSNLSFKYYSSSFYFFNKLTNELTYDYEKIPLPNLDILYDKKKSFLKSNYETKSFDLVGGIKISPTEVIHVIADGTKYWIGILNLNSGEIIKTFGTISAPISSQSIQLIDFINGNLIFRTNVVKSLNIKTSVITAIGLDSELYKKTLKNKSIKEVSNDGFSTLVFYDANGNLIKKIPFKEYIIIYENPSIYTIISQYNRSTNSNIINVYDRSGNLIQSKNNLTGDLKLAVSPDNERILISSSENISEYTLIDLNNPINVFGKNPLNASGATVLTPVKYSNTGKYVQIGGVIYFNNKPYFGTWDIAHFSPNDRSLFISNGKETILYDLEERKPISKFKFENDYGEFASMYSRYFFADDYLVIAGRENYIKLNINPSNKTIQNTSATMDRFYNAQPTIPIALNKEDFENKIMGITDVNSKLSYIRSVIENTKDIDLKLHAIAAFTTAVVYNLNVNTDHIIYARNQSESIIKFLMENGIDNSEKEVFKIQSYVYILCQTKIDKNLNSFNHEIIYLVLSNYTADTYIDKKFYQDLKDSMDEYENKAKVNTQTSNTPVSSLPDGDIIWKHSKGSFEFKFKEGDKRIWHEDGGRFIYVEEEFYKDGTIEGSGQILKRKNENVYIKLTFDKCYFKDNSNPNWRLIYNGGFYSKTLARYLVLDDFSKSSQSTSTSTTTSQSNVTVNKAVSNYTFTKAPELKINYIDNREMCCCCDRTYSQYKLRENVMIEEKIHYLTEKLAIFHQQNGNALFSKTRNETQIQNDLANLKAFLEKTYPGNDILIMLTDMYHLSVNSGLMIWNKTQPGSIERFVNKYEIISPFCSSLKCKNDERCKYYKSCKD